MSARKLATRSANSLASCLPAARLRRVWVSASGLALLVWIAWRVLRVVVGAPDVGDGAWTEGTRVLARDGRLLGERPSAEGLRGRATKLDDVSPRLVAATLASEDHRFWDHDGVDRRALLRATWSFATHGRIVSGGSTITQQLVKRSEHRGKPRPRTIVAKVREIARAQELERRLGNRAILEAYLNSLDYGRGLAGPEAAAQGFFGVRAADLSLAQAALLAVLPRAPSALDPYRHRERAVLRQRALLARMQEDGVASREDVDRALAEPLVFRDPRAQRFVAPHVVASLPRAPGELRTTLDFDLQRDLEGIVAASRARLEERGATDAAIVVADVATGDVLAEIGSAAWGDARIAGSVDVVHAKRQPGSTLKPFVYARAFERGVSPMEMLADVPTELGAWTPENFDGTFVGPVAAREALAGSLNVPAVRLAQDLGATEVVDTLRRSGLSLPGGAQRYGLSVALGSGEVTPRELAEAYVTLARAGEHVRLRERASDPTAAPERVFDPAAVAVVADALSDPLARVRGLRTRGPFELPFEAAIKTGTSTAYRDAWTAGFTHERVVVVWVGNANGSPTKKLTGAVGAGPIFFEAMKRAMREVPRAPLWDASLVEEADVCPLSGKRAGPACTDHVHRLFPRGRAPAETCTIHRFATAGRCDPHGAERIVVLPPVFATWLAAQAAGAPGADAHGLPWLLASSVPGCAAATGEPPRIVVVAPHDGAVLAAPPSSVEIAAETRGLAATEPLEVVVDGRVATRLEPPYRALVPIARGDHTLEIRPLDATRAALLGRAAISVR